MKVIKEYLQPTPDGRGGILKPDGNGGPITVTWGEVNNKKRFEELLDWRGDFAKFAYYHNIGCYFTSKKARAYWLGMESHYDNDHFFYITDVPGFEGKKLAFQLRVSNHAPHARNWETSHSNGNIPSIDDSGIIKRPGLKADCCFNLIFNEDARDRRREARGEGEVRSSEARGVKVIIIDCVCNYYKMNEGEQKRIDDFVNAITNGSQPSISYNDVFQLFAGRYPARRAYGEQPLNLRVSGPENIELRPHNYGEGGRTNFDIKREIYGWNGERGNEEITEIPFSYLVDNGIEDKVEFEYKGKKFVFDEPNSVAYPLKKIRQRNADKKSAEQFAPDYEKPIPINLDESIVRIGARDIVEMVKKCLRLLL